MNLEPQDMKQLRKRDKLEKTRDVVIIGGVGAGAYGAVKGGRAAAKAARTTQSEIGRVSRAVRQASRKVNSREVAKEGARLVKKKVKDVFPSATRIAKVLTKKRSFERACTPPCLSAAPSSAVAHRSLIELGGKGQLRDTRTDRYVDPLKVASGLRTGYFPNSEGQKIPARVGIGHAQVIKAAYNKGKKIERNAGRSGRIRRAGRKNANGKKPGSSGPPELPLRGPESWGMPMPSKRTRG